MKVEVQISPKVLYNNGFIFTETMFSFLIVMAALIILAVVVRVFFVPRWAKDFKNISTFRMLIETAVSMFDDNATDFTKKYKSFCAPVYFSLTAVIFFGVLTEVIGLRSPISDLNLTICLGVTSFVLIQLFGILKHRARRLLHFAPIIPLITDIVVPFSMALRLFGSVFSGYLILHIVYSFLPWGLPGILYILFTLFHAVVQSYVYMFLSMNFINEAIE